MAIDFNKLRNKWSAESETISPTIPQSVKTIQAKKTAPKPKANATLPSRTFVPGVAEQTKKFASTPQGTFALSAADSAMLGIFSGAEKRSGNTEVLKEMEKHPVANTAGLVAGSLLPFSGAEKVAGKFIQGSTLAPRMARNAVGGGAVMGLQGAIQGDNPQELAKDVAMGTLFGVGADALFAGLAKGFKLVSGKVLKSADDLYNATDDELSEVASQIGVEPDALRTIVRGKKLAQQIKTTEIEKTVDVDSNVMKTLEAETNKNISQIFKGISPKEKSTLNESLKQYKAGELDIESLYDAMSDAAKSIPFAKTGNKQIVEDIRSSLKNGILVTDDLRQIPDFNDFRRSNVGKIRFSPNGKHVDSLYAELNGKYGNMFPSDITHPVDQLNQILKVVDGNREGTVRVGDAMRDRDIADNFVIPAINELDDLFKLSKKTVKENVDTLATPTFRKHKNKEFKRVFEAQNRPVTQENVPSGVEIPKAGKLEKVASTKIQGEYSIPTQDIGSAVARKKETMKSLNEKYGTIKAGENPERSINVPQETQYGKTMQHYRTILESGTITDETASELTKDIIDGTASYVPVSQSSNVEKAVGVLKNEGLETAYEKFKAIANSGKEFTADDIALGDVVLRELSHVTKDSKRAAEVASDLAVMANETGRNLSAFRILKKLSPEGRLMTVQKMINKLQDGNGTKINLSDEAVSDIINAQTEQEIIEANRRAALEAWEQVPVKWMEKMNAWRYMAMLFNPKTHARNVIGNSLFFPIKSMKDIVGTGLESAFIKSDKVGDKTKAILNPIKDKEIIDIARKDFRNVVDELKGVGKISEAVRPQEAKIFDTKWLEFVRKFNIGALDFEDTMFMKTAYSNALAGWIKANKIKNFDVADQKIKDMAREYAKKEALKSTYRDFNSFSAFIAKTKRGLSKEAGTASGNFARGAGSVAMEAVVPFTKTPVNLIRRGLEYSPIELIPAIVKGTKEIKNGTATAAEVLDNIASSLTGTAVVGLGAFLAHNGLVSGNEQTDSFKKQNYDSMIGVQNYSLNVGDGSFTIDWAAPMAMPFFLGVEAYNSLAQKDSENAFVKILDALGGISDPMFNLTMLQGINNILKGQEGFKDLALSTTTGYAGQYVPTLFGQLARTVDPYRRSYTSTADNATVREFEKFGRKTTAKIPFASKTLEPYIDMWGNEQKNVSPVENFLIPGYYKNKSNNIVDTEIQRLSQVLSDEDATKVLPRSTGYDIQLDGVKYRMTPKEYAQFQRNRGKYAYDQLQKLFTQSGYVTMPDAEKVKAIEDIYDAAFTVGKQSFLLSRGVK